MRTRNIFLTATALCVLSTAAWADKPIPEFYGPLPGYYFICDTKDQIADLATAGSVSGDALMAVAVAYYNQVNSRGEHVCGYQQLPGYWQVGDFQAYGPIYYGDDGHRVLSWAVNIGNIDVAYWALFTERLATDPVQPSSMPPKGREGDTRYILYQHPRIPWLGLLGL